MKILVSMDERIALKSEADLAEIAALVGNQLGRLALSVSRVIVSVRDCTAQKGGIDLICRVTAHLRSGDVITVSEHSDQIAVAASKASNRLRAALNKSLERKQLYQKHTLFTETSTSEASYEVKS